MVVWLYGCMVICRLQLSVMVVGVMVCPVVWLRWRLAARLGWQRGGGNALNPLFLRAAPSALTEVAEAAVGHREQVAGVRVC